MAVPSQPASIASPQSRRFVQEGSTFLPREEYVPTSTNRNPSSFVEPMLDPTIVQQPPVPASWSDTSNSKRFFYKLSQLAKRAMGEPSIDDPEHRAEEGLPSASAGSPLPPATSPAGSSSPTIHTDEGTTAVGHDYDPLPLAQTMGSPVYIEPKPTNDYAKMDSPRASIASLNSYMNRVKQFFHEFNELPWVAERVTVDYIPGASKDRRRVRINQLHRPVSWYGNTPHSRRPSLFSDSTESPGAQLPQVQLPSQDQSATLRSLDRGHSVQQPPSARQESPRAPTVLWEIIDSVNPSNVPFATVVPANWTLHQAVPSEPFQPTMPTQRPQPVSHPPPQSQSAANPPLTAPQQPASTWLYPGRSTDGFQRFVPAGETFPTGYVPYENVASIEAAYQDGRFHPESQDPVPRQSGSASMAVQAGQDGFGTGAPQMARGLDTPFVTASGQAGSANISVSSAPTPYIPSTQPPVVAPTPRVASGSAAPTPDGGPSNIGASPRATVVSRASSGRPPSAAPTRTSRTSQRSHGPAPSVRTMQNENRPPSTAPSRASHASSAAPSMSHIPNRTMSAAMSNASRRSSVRASQSHPSSVTSSHASRAPSAGAHTPRPMQFPQSITPPAA
ncbi:hypothetical protein C0989_005387 [Termitomyces sp. Mn162]|nr:hypothetical protein C0989_005387 [Termitomyces sp. Mn162]